MIFFGQWNDILQYIVSEGEVDILNYPILWQVEGAAEPITLWNWHIFTVELY